MTSYVSARILRWLAVLVVLIPTAVFAQLYTASLTGVVTDPSGGVIPNAKVTVTDADKGFTYTGTADSTGRLLMRNLPPASTTSRCRRPGSSPISAVASRSK